MVWPMEAVSRELPLGRLDAFSDAVFAIAITLLVLELGIDADAAPHLLSSILHQWPSYLAYATSFLTVGVIWLQHSAVTGSLRVADVMLYRLNLIVLLLASFLPFPTKLLSEFLGNRGAERVAAVFYGLTLMALGLALSAFARYASELRARGQGEVAVETVDSVLRTPSMLIYGIGIGISLLFPTAGVVTYLASAIARGLPTQAMKQQLRRL
jgi:uncharacterized membrane protein